MSTMIERIRNFIKSEDGPTAVEYAIMVGLIAVVIIVAVQQLGQTTMGIFQDVDSTLSTNLGS